MNKSKKAVLIALSLPVALLLAIAFIFQGSQLEYIQWVLALVVTSVMWFGFVLLFFNINKQVDENPYYTEMVIRKRDEVRLRQKMYAASHKS